MEKKIPGPMVGDTDYTPGEPTAVRPAPGFEQEYWVRQSRASLHRAALVAEGTAEAGMVPTALNSGSSINGGLYGGWFPDVDCGGVGDDAVSGNCGSARYEIIWLDCGGV